MVTYPRAEADLAVWSESALRPPPPFFFVHYPLFYPRSRKRDRFQTLATGVPNLKTELGTQRVKLFIFVLRNPATVIFVLRNPATVGSCSTAHSLTSLLHACLFSAFSARCKEEKCCSAEIKYEVKSLFEKKFRQLSLVKGILIYSKPVFVRLSQSAHRHVFSYICAARFSLDVCACADNSLLTLHSFLAAYANASPSQLTLDIGSTAAGPQVSQVVEKEERSNVHHDGEKATGEQGGNCEVVR